MDARKIRFLVELKAGSQTWRKDSTMEAPFPAVIMTELRANASGKVWPATIEVIEREVSQQKAKKEERKEDISVDLKVEKEAEGTSSSEDTSTAENKTEKPKKKPPIRKQ